LSRADKGPDSEFSLEPHELKQLCIDTKIAWESLGVAGYNLKNSEKTMRGYRRSLYVVKNIKKGEGFSLDNVRSIRPGLGIEPKYLEMVLQRKASCDISEGTPFSMNFIL